MPAALENIRVLDLTRVLAGPYVTMLLADLGADVIKVEAPETGDDSRGFPPFINGESAYFMSLNRNKRSIILDLKKPQGKDILVDLARRCDILVENFRPGTMEKLGLGYSTLCLENPRLIYASVSGFGQTGPYSQRPAYDGVVQAMGGIMSITGQAGGAPTRVGASIGDITAGLFGTIGILAALAARNTTGAGQMVDVAMLDCQVAILENAISRCLVNGTPPLPEGNRHPSIVPFEPFETLDGQIMVAAGNDTLWTALCQVLALDHLADDPRFKTNPLRNDHYSELRPLLAEPFYQQTTQSWCDILDAAGIPNGPINTIDKVIQNPQVIAREMVVGIEHPIAGTVKMAGIPTRLSETPGSIHSPAPLLGQHTCEILKTFLGYDPNQINLLLQKGIVK